MSWTGARVALGSLIGAAAAAALAPYTRPFFSPPKVGVGFVTVNAYPKSWDYAVVALLVFGALAGGAAVALFSRIERAPQVDEPRVRRARVWIGSAAVFVLMLFVHDHPYANMDPFHEGEHLTAGWLMKSGERPYGDFYIFHGLAVDAGLDALSLGNPPSPLGPRRLQLVLDAATLALLVPIAAEVCATGVGAFAGVYASLCAIAALWLPVFPYFRMAPVLIAALALLRYVRNGSARALFAAAAASALGLVWSLDTGMYAVAGTAGAIVMLRLFRLEAKPLPLPRMIVIGAVAMLLPFAVLLAVRADVRQFLVDSFVILPRAIDATWALPAPATITAESLRYFLPPAFYGFFLALALLAWRRGDRKRAAQLVIVTIFSLLLFRTASGRVGWSHTRFALPLFGIALIAFILEPLVLRVRRGWIAALALAIPLFFHLEIAENSAAGVKLAAEWRSRQSHAGMVPFPTKGGRGIYTTSDNAIDLASLAGFVDSLGPADAPIFDMSNERALYYLLQRKPPTRVMEVSMLSVPELLDEALRQLEANPPVAVILKGYPSVTVFDGVPNEVRVPELARWVDAHYRQRTQIGRFLVAHR